jgi:hypothetical protein
MNPALARCDQAAPAREYGLDALCVRAFSLLVLYPSENGFGTGDWHAVRRRQVLVDAVIRMTRPGACLGIEPAARALT